MWYAFSISPGFSGEDDGGVEGVPGVLHHPWPLPHIHCKGESLNRIIGGLKLVSFQNTVAKVAWLSIVCLGFLGAGVLINKSYSEWQSFPVSTSISTHSLEDLDFPTVVICPPENSNTALNYDLLRAANYSFSKENRDRLVEAVWEHFIAEDHELFAEDMLAASNPSELEQVYNSIQSVPKPYNHGYEIVVWNTSGTISSARYREDFHESHFLKNRDIHIILAFPANIADQVGSGYLKIELEVDIRQENGWIEEVQYSEGTPYKAFSEEKTWEEAEAHCQSRGGHLASVLSEWENREVKNEMTRPNMFLGGKLDKNGAHSWSDRSRSTFTQWNPTQSNSKAPPHCSLATINYGWSKTDCEKAYHFICRLPANRVNTTALKLEYKREDLKFSSFQVWYKYRAASKNLLNSWEGKRITGFKLSWKIVNNNPPLDMTTADVGKSFTTPGFGQPADGDFYNVDHNFNATMLFPADLSEQIDNDSLLIEMQIKRNTRKHGKEEFFYTEPRYVLQGFYYQYEESTWTGAENYCKRRGGHLASAESILEIQTVVNIAKDRPVWLGGREVEGKWGWSNGGNMRNKTWHSTHGNHPYCLVMRRGYFFRDNCENYYHPFICTLPVTSKIESNTSLIRSYTSGQVASVPSIKVGYRYQAPNKQRLGNLENQITSGFKIDWYVKDENGSQISSRQTQKLDQMWKEAENEPARKENKAFQNFVNLAGSKSLQYRSKDDIIQAAISTKIQLIEPRGLDHINCKNETTSEWDIGQFLQALTKGSPLPAIQSNISQEDIALGLSLYMIGRHCPKETMKLSQFLLRLAKEESLPTFLLATVNTLQSGQLTLYHKLLLGKIYHVLDDLFGLDLGKILLATSSPDQLTAVLNQDLPFLTSTDQLVQNCLSGASCKAVLGQIQGNTNRWISDDTFCFGV